MYTPREIVDYMCQSVEDALKEEFGLTLASPEVVMLDPCTGTGNFVVNLIDRIPPSALETAYRNRLFANEVMLLPYYVASLNIEHAYYERMQRYEPFEGLCFVDTLDMAEAKQHDMFTPANTERVQREKEAAITVIIGNPPYNVGQKSENDNNRNRKYKEVDARIRDTYAKDSKATNKNSLSDMYVKFFRWATDRLGDRDGIVCFVSNNSFVDQIAFDGMRKHLLRDFQHVDHIDLHGNVRRNPKLSGATHNVFGIQVGVGITLAVRKHGGGCLLRYCRVPELWRRKEKLDFLADRKIPWTELSPDATGTWLVPEHASEYHEFTATGDMFDLHTVGLQTNRDDVVYDWNRENLARRVVKLVEDYNAEVDRFVRTHKSDWPDHIKWSSRLKQTLLGGQHAVFGDAKLRVAAWRPFTKKWVFFDRILNHRVYKWPEIPASTRVICITAHSQTPFSALMTNAIASEGLGFAAGMVSTLLPPQGISPHPIPRPLLRSIHHQGRHLLLHLRPSPPSRLPHPVCRQSQARAAANSVRSGFPRLRPRRTRAGSSPRGLRIAQAMAPRMG